MRSFPAARSKSSARTQCRDARHGQGRSGVPDRWHVRADRLPRYGLPLVTVRLSELLRAQLVVSPADASTSFAHHVIDYLHGPSRGSGRRVILSDVGPAVAK